eukprot:3901367-Lingulodinium_polyedra.AAC.1
MDAAVQRARQKPKWDDKCALELDVDLHIEDFEIAGEERHADEPGGLCGDFDESPQGGGARLAAYRRAAPR